MRLGRSGLCFAWRFVEHKQVIFLGVPRTCKVYGGQKVELFHLTRANADILIVNVAVKHGKVDVLRTDKVGNVLPDQFVFVHQEEVAGDAVCFHDASAAVEQDNAKVHGVDQPVKVALQIHQIMALVIDEALLADARCRLSDQTEPCGIHMLLVAGKNADERGNFVALVKNGGAIADIGCKRGLVVFTTADTHGLAGIETGTQRVGAGSCLQQGGFLGYSDFRKRRKFVLAAVNAANICLRVGDDDDLVAAVVLLVDALGVRKDVFKQRRAIVDGVHPVERLADAALGNRAKSVDVFQLGAVPGFGNCFTDPVEIGVEIRYEPLAQVVDLAVCKQNNLPLFSHCIMRKIVCQHFTRHICGTKWHTKINENG